MSDDQSQPLNSDNSLLYQRPESSEAPLKIPRFDEEDDWGDEDEEEPKESIISDGVMNRNPRIQRYLVAIEYIGTRFSGAQQQSNCRTVVGVLEVKSYSISSVWFIGKSFVVRNFYVELFT